MGWPKVMHVWQPARPSAAARVSGGAARKALLIRGIGVSFNLTQGLMTGDGGDPLGGCTALCQPTHLHLTKSVRQALGRKSRVGGGRLQY